MRKQFKELYGYNSRIKRGERLSFEEARKREELVSAVTCAIDSLEDECTRMGLYERYIKAMKWCDVADAMGYFSDDSVRKRCERAINKLM